jgi:hypothetical protein
MSSIIHHNVELLYIAEFFQAIERVYQSMYVSYCFIVAPEHVARSALMHWLPNNDYTVAKSCTEFDPSKHRVVICSSTQELDEIKIPDGRQPITMLCAPFDFLSSNCSNTTCVS